MTRTVLVVDDAVAIREVVAFTLRGAGYAVVEAEDGAEALAKAATQPFAAVLTDLNMPRMDGLELVRRLRQRAEWARLPILVLTTEASAEMKARGRAAGATGWLLKPFEPARLLEVVARMLG